MDAFLKSLEASQVSMGMASQGVNNLVSAFSS